MITFRHTDKKIQLDVGETWCAPVGGKTYRDTPACELQAIVSEVESGAPWREVVHRYYAEENPWLYHTVASPKRGLFFRHYLPCAGMKVIDIGAGWGQASLSLAQQNEVTALEPTPERLAFIRAAAVQNEVNSQMYFVQADFFDVKFESRFDLACCIGVLEWVPKFREGDPRSLQIDFLKRVHSLLKPGGQLVLGIENRVGLKYLVGAADDHIGTPGVALYDTDLAARKWRKVSGQDLRSFTYTKSELEELLELAGFQHAAFYAAMPDYKLPEVILPLGSATEDHFAHKPHILEHDGTNGRPLADAQQEELHSHYRSLARMGVAGNFAPSYFVVAQSAQTVPPSPERILSILRQAGTIPSTEDVELELYPTNIKRKDSAEKWAYKVTRGRRALFHLIVANGGLNRAYERAVAFAQACPDVACKPLFFLESEESSLQLFGQEHFEGETLDAAVARGACDAEQWLAAVNAAMTLLEKSLSGSSVDAYEKELKELEDGVLAVDALGILDKHLLREWIFPALREARRKTEMQARWTNGDFIGGNLLRNVRGDVRLVDCESAHSTHFFGADSIRLRKFSILPPELNADSWDQARGSAPVEELHFWLLHLQMLHTIVRPEFFVSDVPMIMERVLTLASETKRDRSQVRVAWSAARKQARFTGLERDSLRRQRDSLLRERDSLLREGDSLLHDRDNLVHERDSLLHERDSLLHERDSLLHERDSLLHERDSLLHERDSLLHERDSLRRERDALLRQTKELGERIAKLEEQVDHLKITRFEAKRECHSMKTSFSWKVTWPLRALLKAILAARDRARS